MNTRTDPRLPYLCLLFSHSRGSQSHIKPSLVAKLWHVYTAMSSTHAIKSGVELTVH